MKELVFVRERPLGPLMVAVHKLCVIGQAFIVTDVLVQGVPIVADGMGKLGRPVISKKDNT